MELNTKRTCSRCNADYAHYGQKASLCKECRKAYNREYHERRPRDAKLRKQRLQVARINAMAEKVNTFKTKAGCMDCGNSDFRVLDFDHLPEYDKTANISDLVRGGHGEKTVMTEVSKCDVVCANCHRIRTFKRRKTL